MLIRAVIFSALLHFCVLSLWVSQGCRQDPFVSPRLAAKIHGAMGGVNLLQVEKTVALSGQEYPRKDARSSDSSLASVPVQSLLNKGVSGAIGSTSGSRNEPSSIEKSEITESLERAVSVEGIRQYGINLAREARRYKHYPVLARQRGWEGEVRLVVGTAHGMSVPQVSLSQSSGFDALDEGALEIFRQAIRFAEMPTDLQGREFALTLPIRFALDE